MKSYPIKYFTLISALVFLISACGGEEKISSTKTAEKSAAPKVEKAKELSPQEVGQKVGTLYVQAMTDVTELLKDKPDVSGVRPKVEAMKDQCIQEMVKLGKLRELLDDAGRSAVDSQIRMKLNSLYNDPVFKTYNEVQQHYFKDQDFHKIVMSFNIITQYASFDLLKKQAPEEADRLGIQ